MNMYILNWSIQICLWGITQISSKIKNTSHTNVSCINCNLVTFLPCGYGYILNLSCSTYIHVHIYCFYLVMGPLVSTKISRILQIIFTRVMTLDWIANGISLRPAMVKTHAMELEEQLNGWYHGQAFKVHWKDRSCQWDSCLTGVCVISNILHSFSSLLLTLTAREHC